MTQMAYKVTTKILAPPKLYVNMHAPKTTTINPEDKINGSESEESEDKWWAGKVSMGVSDAHFNSNSPLT